MTKRTITKLFAVGALAISAQASASPNQPTSAAKPRTLPNGRPACGNVTSKVRRPCPDTATTAAAPKPAPAPAVPATRPRTLPSGAPACGNVGAKNPNPQPCVAKPRVQPAPKPRTTAIEPAVDGRAARVVRAV